jgi:hypothetical protein
LASLAGGCRAKAVHAAEAVERRCYAGSLLRLPDQRPWARAASSTPPAHVHRRRATGARPAGRLGQPGHCPAPPLPGPAPGSAELGEKTRAQLPDERRALPVLVRSLFPRHDVQTPSCWPRSNAACSICRMGLPSGRANEPSGRTFTRRNRPSRGPLTEQIQQCLTGPRKGWWLLQNSTRHPQAKALRAKSN